ncbi:AroM family protein [Virgibacillus proomii]|nr:AroM family protein [Virgibacillus proomii]
MKIKKWGAVKIGKQRLLSLLQRELTKLEMRVEVVIMLCTGDFPTLKATNQLFIQTSSNLYGTSYFNNWDIRVNYSIRRTEGDFN